MSFFTDLGDTLGGSSSSTSTTVKSTPISSAGSNTWLWVGGISAVVVIGVIAVVLIKRSK